MPVAAIGTLVFAGLLIAALAVYLLTIIFLLRRILDRLGLICFGVRAIAHRAEPITPMLTDVNTDLTAVANALEKLADKATAKAAANEPPAKVS